MDHARFCRGVVFRGVPGINNVIIGAVPALCENAPVCPRGWLLHQPDFAQDGGEVRGTQKHAGCRHAKPHTEGTLEAHKERTQGTRGKHGPHSGCKHAQKHAAPEFALCVHYVHML